MAQDDAQERSLADLRKDYMARGLDESELDADPIRQFRGWFDAALDAGLTEPNAMTLATVGADGRPSARMVLIKGVSEAGFVFYTNYESRKGRELAATPWAALVFYWAELERQVRIEGSVEKASKEEAVRYFSRRPRKSQLGAWASHQDAVVASRSFLEHKFKKMEEKFQGNEVPLPPYWGGFLIIPKLFEFWQGREDRLHDRFRYRRQEPKEDWLIERLSP